MTRFYADPQNEWFTPTAPVMRGGEAEVSHCREKPGWLLKVRLTPPEADYLPRTTYLMTVASKIGRERLSLPLGVLREGKGGPVVGCLLRKEVGPCLEDVVNARWREDRGIVLDPRERVRLALEFAENVRLLHTERLVLVDGNLQNQFVRLNLAGDILGIVSIDTDSYGVVAVRDATGRVTNLPSTAAAEDYASPEWLDGAREGTQAGDKFIAAIVVFLVLTDDHPTAGVLDPTAGALDIPARIRRGLFPALRHDPRTGLRAKEWTDGIPTDRFPADLTGLFYDALIAGHKKPAERPPLSEWVRVLREWHGQFGRRPRRVRLPVLRYLAAGAICLGVGLAPALARKAWTLAQCDSGPPLWRALR